MATVNPKMAATIKDRRLELGYDLPAFIAATGLTRQGLAPLLAGEIRNYQERLTLPVTRVLRWTPDSIERLMADDEPIPTAGDGEDDWSPADELARRLDALESRVERLQHQIEDVLIDGRDARRELLERLAHLEQQGGQTGDPSSS